MISTKILDKRFSSMLEDFNIYCENNNTDINSVFCKAGLYSKRVMGYESMHQGKFAEKILIGLTGATELYTDGKESGSHYGNCDFQYKDLEISMKSSIRKEGVFKKDGSVGASSKAKIFDASRKSFVNSDELLSKMLFSAGYEIPIMAYIYELESNRGMLFMSSLHEIAGFKDNIDLDKIRPKNISKLWYSIESLFEYNNASHYLIPLKHVYNTAKHHGRLLEFKISDEDADEYVQIKKNEIIPSLDLIK